MKNKTNEVENSFHSLFVFIIAEEKKRKKRLSNAFSSFNNFHSFSLIQYHQTNHNQSQSNHDENEKRKRWKWTSSTTIEQIETPSFNARVKRGWIQTTLPQLPAFPTFCNYLNTRSPPMRIDTPQVIRADRDLSHWCCRRLYPIQQSNEWVWRAWQEKYPTRWEMTIHYTANDYSLFKAKQSLQEKAK